MNSVDTTRGANLSVRDRSDRLWRAVMDEDGHLWRVREVSFADAAPSLIFESDSGFRRIRQYPTNWQTLSDAELYELSWRT